MSYVSLSQIWKWLGVAVVVAIPSFARAGVVHFATPMAACRPATFDVALDSKQLAPSTIMAFPGHANATLSEHPAVAEGYKSDQIAYSNSASGHILDPAPRVSLLIATAYGNGNIQTDQRADAANPAPAGIDQFGKDEAHGLALPDSLRMFPLGALVAALAIRRMQRRAGHT